MSISNLSSRRQKQSSVASKAFYGISNLKKFNIQKKLGEGTFGIVYKAQQEDKEHNYVAIKRILQRDLEDSFPVTAYREMAVLKGLKNDNIIELVDVLLDKPGLLEEKQDMTSKIGKSFYLVFPYMSYDLTGILQDPSIQLTIADNKSIMKQMLEGLDYIHTQGFLHRDIKASNILIHHSGMLKIGDFGLARKYKGKRATLTEPGGGAEPLTEVVMTRWYRAPEVLMGNRLYTTAVDLWASGCILGELYEKKPILPGKSDLDQAHDIFTLVGPPDSRTMPGFEMLKMTPKLLIERRPPTLHTRFSSLINDNEAVDLMHHLLLLDHKKRYTARKALNHHWFKTEPLPNNLVETNFKETHESDVIHKKQKIQPSQPDADTPSKLQVPPPVQPFQGNSGHLPITTGPPAPVLSSQPVALPPLPPPSGITLPFTQPQPTPPPTNRPNRNFISAPTAPRHFQQPHPYPSGYPQARSFGDSYRPEDRNGVNANSRPLNNRGARQSFGRDDRFGYQRDKKFYHDRNNGFQPRERRRSEDRNLDY